MMEANSASRSPPTGISIKIAASRLNQLVGFRGFTISSQIERCSGGAGRFPALDQ